MLPKKDKLYSAVCCTGDGPKCFLVKAANKKEAEKKVRDSFDMYLEGEELRVKEIDSLLDVSEIDIQIV